MGDDRSAGVTFQLVDAEARGRDHPETFEMPGRFERETVSPGQLVKLIFELAAPTEQDPSAERMWVMVKNRDGSLYLGELDNEPYSIPDLHAGDPVMFGPENIIDIWVDD